MDVRDYALGVMGAWIGCWTDPDENGLQQRGRVMKSPYGDGTLVLSFNIYEDGPCSYHKVTVAAEEITEEDYEQALAAAEDSPLAAAPDRAR
jgi:hypothetical protein